jgi:hypothetical protein
MTDPGAEAEGFAQGDFAVATANDPKGQYNFEGGFPQGIVRVEVQAEGYEPLLTFVTHLYTDQCAGGPCTRHDFALWPVGQVHEMLPDLIPDATFLHPSWLQLTNACDGRDDVAVCLRAQVGVANMGTGDLFMSAPVADPSLVTQHIFDSTGATGDRLVEGEFARENPWDLIAFPRWVHTSLRKIDDTCNTLANAERCPITRESIKDSVCVRDYIQVEPLFDPQRRYDCVVTDGNIEQGIGAGYMDIDNIEFLDQFIDVTGLASGEYWIETAVNPDHRVHESDYGNNVARARYVLELPECGNGVVEFPESCEGDDVNGATCEAIDERFNGGKLACNAQCGFDRSACTIPKCKPKDIGSVLGRAADGDNRDAFNTTSPLGCSVPTGTGRDLAFAWTAPEAGRYSMVDIRGGLLISVRDEDCDGAELACATELSPDGVAVELEQGQKVAILLDVYPGRDGKYSLQITGPN